MRSSVLVFFIIFFSDLSYGQIFSREEAISLSLQNHPQIHLNQKQIEQQKALQKGSIDIAKTSIWVEDPSGYHYTPGIQQNFSYPGVYVNQYKLQKENVKLAETAGTANEQILVRNVKLAYLDLQYAQARYIQLLHQDSVFRELYRAAEKRYKAGEAGSLEKITAEAKYMEMQNQFYQLRKTVENAGNQLNMLCGIKMDTMAAIPLAKYETGNLIPYDTAYFQEMPLLKFHLQNRQVSARNLRLQRTMAYPDFVLGYINQGPRDHPLFYRFRVGVAVPLWFPAYTARIKAASLGVESARLQYEVNKNFIAREFLNAFTAYEKASAALQYYEETGLNQAEAILRTSGRAYILGEINYVTYLQSIQQAIQIKLAYIDALRDYNQAVVMLEYLR